MGTVGARTGLRKETTTATRLLEEYLDMHTFLLGPTSKERRGHKHRIVTGEKRERQTRVGLVRREYNRNGTEKEYARREQR